MRAGAQALRWVATNTTDDRTATDTASMGADAYSLPVDITSKTGFSVQAAFLTGTTPTGALLLQVSNDKTNWSDLASSSQSITATGTYMWNIAEAYYAYVRIFWDRTTGSGTLSALLVSKA